MKTKILENIKMRAAATHVALKASLLPAILLLAACGGNRAEPEPEPEPSETATAEPVQSIIRDDIEQPEILVPLEPLEARIGFPEGGYELDEAALESLTEILASRQMAKGGAVTLGGHTDAAGNDTGNITASQKRAEAVRDWLTENEIAEDRITIIAFGEQNPAEPNANPDGTENEAGRAANRRVELAIAVPGENNEEDTSETPDKAAEDGDTPPEG